MKKFLSTFFRLFFLVCLPILGMAQHKPELALDKEGIKIYLTKLDTTRFKEYKAVMTVKAPMDSIVKQLVDIKNFKKWNYKAKKSELIKKISDSSWIFYMNHHMGWPVQERDHVSRVTLTKKSNERIITITPHNNLIKEKKGIVRLTNFKGYWLLRKISEDKTLVIQQIYGNPEGDIPPFMVNLIITKGPFDTFKALRAWVEKLNKK